MHNYCGISCEKIGMFCSIGPGVIIGGKNEGKPTIGDYVTNCANSIVIGNNSLIGAGSLVTKDVPENVIVVGCPAKILKKRN